MNKEFVKKMLQAKQFEYEAIKEILPDNLRKKVDSVENDVIELMKDVAFDLLKDCVAGNFNRSDENNEKSTNNSSSVNKDNEKKKSSRKINVDFM